MVPPAGPFVKILACLQAMPARLRGGELQAGRLEIGWLRDVHRSGRAAHCIERGVADLYLVYGKQVMVRGWATRSDYEGKVSDQVVKLRTSMDYPIVPWSIPQIIESYLNMTQYLGDVHDDASHATIGLENVMDVFWPLPLLQPLPQLRQQLFLCHPDNAVLLHLTRKPQLHQ